MVSPAYYALHPIAAFFDDCGLGSDPDASGPCTGTGGPGTLSGSVVDQLATGKAEVLAVGAALLILLAILVLIRMIRKPLGVRASPAGSADLDGYVCRKCGFDDVSGSSVDQVTCGACGFVGNADSAGDDREMSDEEFVAKLESLEPGEAWCVECNYTYWTDGDDLSCPGCGGGGRDDDEDSEGIADFTPVRECAVCGTLTDVEELEENGDWCNVCQRTEEERHYRTGSGVGGGEGVR